MHALRVSDGSRRRKSQSQSCFVESRLNPRLSGDSRGFPDITSHNVESFFVCLIFYTGHWDDYRHTWPKELPV